MEYIQLHSINTIIHVNNLLFEPGIEPGMVSPPLLTRPDLAHNRANQPQYCRLRKMLLARSRRNRAAMHSIAGSVKRYGPWPRP